MGRDQQPDRLGTRTKQPGTPMPAVLFVPFAAQAGGYTWKMTSQNDAPSLICRQVSAPGLSRFGPTRGRSIPGMGAGTLQSAVRWDRAHRIHSRPGAGDARIGSIGRAVLVECGD